MKNTAPPEARTDPDRRMRNRLLPSFSGRRKAGDATGTPNLGGGPWTRTRMACSRHPGNGRRPARPRSTPGSVVYEELRAMAGKLLSDKAAAVTIAPTSLVHEAYLRLLDQRRTDWHDRLHFFRIAAQVMRRVLVDHCRTRAAQKRGGAFLALDLEEAAHVPAPSKATVKRDWTVARAFRRARESLERGAPTSNAPWRSPGRESARTLSPPPRRSPSSASWPGSRTTTPAPAVSSGAPWPPSVERSATGRSRPSTT